MKGLIVFILALSLADQCQGKVFFKTELECLNSLPTGKYDGLCIECLPKPCTKKLLTCCPSGFKWMMRQNRRVTKAAGGTGRTKCNHGFYLDGTGNCVPIFNIPDTSHEETWANFFTTTSTMTTRIIVTTTTSETTEKAIVHGKITKSTTKQSVIQLDDGDYIPDSSEGPRALVIVKIVTSFFVSVLILLGIISYCRQRNYHFLSN